MSQTPITVTYSLEEVLTQINRKLDNLQKDVNDSRLETKVAIQELKGDIKSLDEKVNGLSKRLDNQEFVSRGILVALVVAIIGGAAKLFGWVGNP
ncbi:DUF4164 family protein [Pannus brasiliensis CCIBt3594]|uniref:DUF4164 family protein n=1 Tax=Pannus brasiliensis CCIBt3594 TaxID=1427578 RepID=A0AAW9QPH7_9CHRO